MNARTHIETSDLPWLRVVGQSAPCRVLLSWDWVWHGRQSKALVVLTSLNDDKKWKEQSGQQRRTVGDRKNRVTATREGDGHQVEWVGGSGGHETESSNS